VPAAAAPWRSTAVERRIYLIDELNPGASANLKRADRLR
jgi:hypothetical protein